jgi:hypothetical protein
LMPYMRRIQWKINKLGKAEGCGSATQTASAEAF